MQGTGGTILLFQDHDEPVTSFTSFLSRLLYSRGFVDESLVKSIVDHLRVFIHVLNANYSVRWMHVFAHHRHLSRDVLMGRAHWVMSSTIHDWQQHATRFIRYLNNVHDNMVIIIWYHTCGVIWAATWSYRYRLFHVEAKLHNGIVWAIRILLLARCFLGIGKPTKTQKD